MRSEECSTSGIRRATGSRKRSASIASRRGLRLPTKISPFGPRIRHGLRNTSRCRPGATSLYVPVRRAGAGTLGRSLRRRHAITDRCFWEYDTISEDILDKRAIPDFLDLLQKATIAGSGRHNAAQRPRSPSISIRSEECPTSAIRRATGSRERSASIASRRALRVPTKISPFGPRIVK